MAAVPPGFADVSVKIVLSGMTRPAYITFGVDPTSADPDQVASSVASAFATTGGFMTRMSTLVGVGPVTVRLGQDGGESLIGFDEQTRLGARTFQAPPSNVAALIHKRSSRGGRRGRGKLFLPWAVDEGNVDSSGNISSVEYNPWNTALEVWRNDLSARAVPMVILHEPGITTPGAPNTVTSLQMDRLVATQRRRLGR